MIALTLLALLVTNPAFKHVTTDSARQGQIEGSKAPDLIEEHHCQKARATRKIDLTKSQPVSCHVFECRVSAPQEALERLVEGNHRFASETLDHPNRSREDRLATAEGQTPFAVIVGCSDSRVSPEILFDQGIGDLFTVRVAGNVIGPIELDSIHYSALYLGSSLILVLGHEGCGAIHAVLDGKSDQIESIARYIAPSIKKAKHDHKDRGGILECSIKDNICYGVRLLRKNRALATLIKEEKLAIIGGYYHFETGLVELLDDAEW